jgi:hypothetical protein
MKIVEVILPKVLYHSTYEPLLSSIKQNGLGGGTRKNWEDSVEGLVYLATSEEIAISYAETCDTVDEEWLDKIITFEVLVDDLDINKLEKDSNVIDGNDTFQYAGIIPFTNLRRLS